MDAMARVTGIDFTPEIAPAAPATRRASSRPANSPPATSTGKMRHDLLEMVASAWIAWQRASRRGAGEVAR